MFPSHSPPFGSTVNVVCTASQCAYSVASDVISTIVELSILSPSVSSVYQSLNIYPSFVGVGNSPYSCLYVTSFVSGSTVAPSPGLNVTVNVASVHFAVNSILSVISTIVVFSIFDSPSYHPSKSYPDFTGVGKSPYSSPYVTSFVSGSTVASSPGLNVTVYLFAVQCAYNVISESGIYGVSTFVPSVASVYHPSNVYPSLVGVGNSTLLSVYCAVIVAFPAPYVYVVPDIEPSPVSSHLSNVFVCIISCVCDIPSLLSNVTLYPFGATGFSISVVILYAPSTV